MLNPLDAIGFTLHREPQLLLKPLKDFVSPLYSLSQKTLTYNEALRLSHQWCELAARIVLYVACSYGIRKISEKLYERVSSWAFYQLKSTITSSQNTNENRGTRFQESSFIDDLKFDLIVKIPEQIIPSQTIVKFFDSKIKTGKFFGMIASFVFGSVAYLILSQLEYKTTPIIYYRNLYYLSAGFSSFLSSLNAIWALNQTHSTIYHLKIAEIAELILARKNLLPAERYQYLDPQAIAGLTLQQILLVLPSLPQEIRTLPIDTLLQKIAGPLLKTIQCTGKTQGLLTPLIERCASLSAPYLARAVGYARV